MPHATIEKIKREKCVSANARVLYFYEKIHSKFFYDKQLELLLLLINFSIKNTLVFFSFKFVLNIHFKQQQTQKAQCN